MFLSDRIFACLPSINEPRVAMMTHCKSDDEEVKHPFAATELMAKAEFPHKSAVSSAGALHMSAFEPKWTFAGCGTSLNAST